MLTPPTREFDFNQQDFEKIRKLIYDYAGIALSPAKHDMVYGRLAKRLRALNLKTFGDYLKVLERGDHREMELFTNSLTTNLTSFFREAHHFEILGDYLKANRQAGTLNLWCSASSTGEEPYSLAITACEAFDSLRPPVKIIATDLDTNVLEVAKAGIYAAEEVDKLGATRVKRFFTKHPTGKYQLVQELRDMIVFRKLNLIAPDWMIRGPFDAIFCRNVMIYFDKPTQLKILQRFAPLLKPEGLLYVGHSENLYHAADLFKLRGKTVYELARPGLSTPAVLR
ncbi:chemotaxis protein methyltransferase CheR [Andreprevotia lacus DSM 23236]|jgi:chemotaxis protein methyltransferase CheR|uniref:Chemotaxis protein methyltransferase n=1 Tax=Andreprevotia lacus DSM 23236 TaxID=1121001 RepID=A0A1W1XE62_9NEIS|nr:CheR family methyltransferase [Andreprevotia lacus]SMC22179.1 chemotaxis protein methyltransferase CheR [Andreprevotia lacus DSM 23236]